MSINAMMTVENNTRLGADAREHPDLLNRTAYELGWTQSAFAMGLNQIEARYGEKALLKILDAVCINPIYASVD